MAFPTFQELSHALVQYEPADGELGEKLDQVRGCFQNLIDDVAVFVPNDANGTLAARSIHAACQAVILAMIKEGQ
jgi:hypothetical protein